MEGSFTYKNSRFHFLRYGEGKFPLIAFHGFGQNAQMFAPLKESLGTRFTIYSFDFAYHGKTEWREPHGFTKSEFLKFLEAFMRQEGFNKISLMGFSMGGRVVLAVIPDMADKLQDVLLLAPDGIEERFYYRSFMAGKPGEALFREMLKHPKTMIAVAGALSRIGLTKKYVAEYMKNYWGDARRRDKLFNVWRSMRTYRARLQQIRKAAEQHSVKMYLLWGNRDKVIPSRMAHRFIQEMPQCRLKIVQGGHFIVQEQLNPVIEELLEHG